MIFAIAKVNAQDYQISFAGTGASITVDSVKVENLTSCTSLNISGNDILHLTIAVGIDELNTIENSSLHIYPTPFTDNCTIDFDATTEGNAVLELYDINGKLIIKEMELLRKGHHAYSLRGIKSGVYFLRIESDSYNYTSKIMSNNLKNGVAGLKHIEGSLTNDNQNTGKIVNLKSSKSVVDMLYATGNRLKLTGKSGNYRTVFMLVPIQTQTVTFNFIPCTDANGNNYPIVQIGTQIWMAENLRATKYRNGVTIPNVTDSSIFANLTTKACCDYNNVPANGIIYGKLYNWYAISDTNNLAPIGWHIATNTEWYTLTNYLGGDIVSGGKLKQNCNTIWQSPNAGATNEAGFTALANGYRNGSGAYDFLGRWAYLWTSSLYGTYPIDRRLDYDQASTDYGTAGKYCGMSVRCVKD